MASLPADVIGVVAEFVESAEDLARQLGRVSVLWREAMLSADAAWLLQMRRLWPQTHARAGRYSVFRARMLAAKQLTPMLPETLHPIENCGEHLLAFKCPMLLEKLTLLHGERGEGGGLVYYCDVCRERVYHVRSQEELARASAEQRCVMFRATSTDPAKAGAVDLTFGASDVETVLVVFVDRDGASAKRAIATVAARIEEWNGGSMKPFKFETTHCLTNGSFVAKRVYEFHDDLPMPVAVGTQETRQLSFVAHTEGAEASFDAAGQRVHMTIYCGEEAVSTDDGGVAHVWVPHEAPARPDRIIVTPATALSVIFGPHASASMPMPPPIWMGAPIASIPLPLPLPLPETKKAKPTKPRK